MYACTLKNHTLLIVRLYIGLAKRNLKFVCAKPIEKRYAFIKINIEPH